MLDALEAWFTRHPIAGFLAAAATVGAAGILAWQLLPGEADVPRGRKSPVAEGDGWMSRAAFRRRLLAQGVDLDGLDVDHVVPSALGGIDHTGNYVLLAASINRGLGAEFSAAKCRIVGAKTCRKAASLSRKHGSFTGRMPRLS